MPFNFSLKDKQLRNGSWSSTVVNIFFDKTLASDPCMGGTCKRKRFAKNGEN